MDITKLTIKTAKEGLKNKQFSSIELTKAYLDQIAKHNADLNVFLTVAKEEALAAAKEADEKLAEGSDAPLLGIPIALKDLFSTKGIKTTAASKLLENYIPQFDATATKKLKDAGSVILGKTNLDAWAHGSSGENSDYPATKNPYNPDYIPGGSSSGSAAAVAAHMSLMSSGSDTGGSIRLPASFTNTVGLKPTYGRVSRYGIISMASSLDSIGHFTKTVEDNALVLNVTAGQDTLDATTPPKDVPDYTSDLQKGVKGLKIGLPKEYFVQGLTPEVKKATEDAVKVLEKLGADIVEVSLPHTEYSVAVYYIIQTAEVSSNLARFDGVRFGNSRSSFGAEAKRRIMLGTYVLSSGYYDAYYNKAMKVRTLLKQDFDKAFKNVDVIVAPNSPTPPWKLGEKVNDPLAMYLSDILTIPADLAGLPGLAVPAGFVNDLPIGIQFMGPQFSEKLLYQVGHAYEQETKFFEKGPNL